jgi:transposase-like protein
MNSDANPEAVFCAPEGKVSEVKGAQANGGIRDDSAAKQGRRKPIRIEDLPPPGITRWVISRKAQVVAAVQAGSISLDDVCQRYSVSVEEFRSWQKLLERHGIYGLRSTRSQIYRDPAEDPQKS